MNLPLKLGYFHFALNKSSLTILSTDRPVPRFESHTGG